MVASTVSVEPYFLWIHCICGCAFTPAVKHADNHGKMASVYLHSPGGRTCVSNIVKVFLHQLQTCIFHQFCFLFSDCCDYCHHCWHKVISTGLANKVKQWFGNTNIFAQSKLRLNTSMVKW